MSIKLLVDMNLSPEWIDVLTQHGIQAVHWASVGDPRASDAAIMEWGRNNGYVVFTHDLEFGTALALTHAAGPSVVQLRGQRVLPEAAASMVVDSIRRHESELTAGVLIVIDEYRSRVRVLPI